MTLKSFYELLYLFFFGSSSSICISILWNILWNILSTSSFLYTHSEENTLSASQTWIHTVIKQWHPGVHNLKIILFGCCSSLCSGWRGFLAKQKGRPAFDMALFSLPPTVRLCLFKCESTFRASCWPDARALYFVCSTPEANVCLWTCCLAGLYCQLV